MSRNLGPAGDKEGMAMGRRRAEEIRYVLESPVAVRTQDAAGRRAFGTCRNVSASGVCVRQERPFRPGSGVEMTLYLRPGLALSMAGYVMWARPEDGGAAWSHGVRFSGKLCGATIIQATRCAAQPTLSVTAVQEDLCSV